MSSLLGRVPRQEAVVTSPGRTGTGPERDEARGIVSGLAAGACWAGYIVVFPRLASHRGRSGALFGLVALGQRVSLLQWGGMLAVTAASIGATSTRPQPPDVPPPG
jgi:threonine/homoserine efflux transporter RhtA